MSVIVTNPTRGGLCNLKKKKEKPMTIDKKKKNFGLWGGILPNWYFSFDKCEDGMCWFWNRDSLVTRMGDV